MVYCDLISRWRNFLPLRCYSASAAVAGAVKEEALEPWRRLVAVSIYCGVSSIVSIIVQTYADFCTSVKRVLTHRLKLVNQSPPSLLFLQAWSRRRRRLSRRICETTDLKSQRCSHLARRSDLPDFLSSPQVTQTSTFLSPPVSSSGRFGLVYTVCSVLKTARR